MHCNALQRTATYCNALQYNIWRLQWQASSTILPVAPSSRKWFDSLIFYQMQRTATHRNTLQHTATHCYALLEEYVTIATTLHQQFSLSCQFCVSGWSHSFATHYNALQRTAAHYDALQQTTMHCIAPQCTTLYFWDATCSYGVATISRLRKNISFFCKRAL